MNRHSTEALSLTFGVIFLAVAASWLLWRWIDLTITTLGWLAAGALIILGGLGLIATVRSALRHPPTG